MYNEKAKQQERITQEKLRSKTMAIKKKKKKGKLMAYTVHKPQTYEKLLWNDSLMMVNN